MPIISTFCKKGGVGKTTFLGYLAHFYANQGKTVLIISAARDYTFPALRKLHLSVDLLPRNSCWLWQNL